jgi:hypothetical protein
LDQLRIAHHGRGCKKKSAKSESLARGTTTHTVNLIPFNKSENFYSLINNVRPVRHDSSTVWIFFSDTSNAYDVFLLHGLKKFCLITILTAYIRFLTANSLGWCEIILILHFISWIIFLQHIGIEKVD